jgi:hypothetical protein
MKDLHDIAIKIFKSLEEEVKQMTITPQEK